MKKQDVFAVANFFLSKKDHSLDNLKLNKIVYISLGFSLGLKDFNLFDDDVQAWRFGPVIPELYYHFKEFQAFIIDRLANNFSKPQIDKEEIGIKEILQTVWNIYRSKTGSSFIEMTHQSGTPWASVYNGERNVIIDRGIIKNYYKKFLNNAINYGNNKLAK